jgi:hypothetical protein
MDAVEDGELGPEARGTKSAQRRSRMEKRANRERRAHVCEIQDAHGGTDAMKAPQSKGASKVHEVQNAQVAAEARQAPE